MTQYELFAQAFIECGHKIVAITTDRGNRDRWNEIVKANAQVPILFEARRRERTTSVQESVETQEEETMSDNQSPQPDKHPIVKRRCSCGNIVGFAFLDVPMRQTDYRYCTCGTVHRCVWKVTEIVYETEKNWRHE